mmetsp:Transcript_5473/g.8051  ORF Transcript_5473/g.8051 Transcript_5473/m.8051 type:complete len:422 (-) Transcript_5473:315-1580(-)
MMMLSSISTVVSRNCSRTALKRSTALLRHKSSTAAAATARWIPVEHSQQNSKNPFVGAEIEPLETLDTSTSNCYSNHDDTTTTTTTTIDQLVLKVMRGHSALIEGSLVSRVSKRFRSKQDADVGKDDSIKRADIMYELVQKGVQFAAERREEVLKMEETEKEEENKEEEASESEEAGTDDDDDDTTQKSSLTEEEQAEHELIQRGILYAKPGCTGPTIEMYDLALDALACSRHPKAVSLSEALLDDLLERYEALSAARDANDDHLSSNSLDDNFDLTLYTPTQASFNAVLRCAANAADVANSMDERRRDEVIMTAFYTLDRLFRADCVYRNAASYAYVLRVIATWIPESRSRGNVARGLFEKACEEGVVNEQVLEALRDAGGGMDFEHWAPSVVDCDIKDLPQKWRRNVKRRQNPHGAILY